MKLPHRIAERVLRWAEARLAISDWLGERSGRLRGRGSFSRPRRRMGGSRCTTFFHDGPVKHPAYQKIIALGQPADPLLLRELKQEPNHWFACSGPQLSRSRGRRPRQVRPARRRLVLAGHETRISVMAEFSKTDCGAASSARSWISSIASRISSVELTGALFNFSGGEGGRSPDARLNVGLSRVSRGGHPRAGPPKASPPSALAEASRVPSGLNATLKTPPVSPPRVSVSCWARASHTFTV